MPRKIIDTHVHIWNLQQAEYSWLDGDTSLINRTYNIEELETEHITAGITEGILVQSANHLQDTQLMLAAAEKTDWIKAVVGWLPLKNPVATARLLSGTYDKNKYFKGVRHLIHIEEDAQWLLQPDVVESLGLLQQAGLSYDLVGILPEHIETALKLAEILPGLRMVFDHINQPPIASGEQFGRWGDLIKTASAHPNFHIKISGLGTTAANPFAWTDEDLKPYINFALEQFGTQRAFCGSDWPMCLLAGSYTSTWEAYQSILAALLNEADTDDVLYNNAKRFYSINNEQLTINNEQSMSFT